MGDAIAYASPSFPVTLENESTSCHGVIDGQQPQSSILYIMEATVEVHEQDIGAFGL